MKQHIRTFVIAAGLIACSATLSPQAKAASFLTTDVTQWIGVADGAGVSEAVMVIQWPGEVSALAWGYRWQTSESKTGADMLSAFVAASNGAFSVTGLAGGFVSDLQWMGKSFPGYNASTGEYLNYFVNNAQVANNYTNGSSLNGGAHILPPLGSPYDESGPGEWISSNTGVTGRPLVDGSWDGWVYRSFGAQGPNQTVNAPAAIPEPSSLLLIAGASLAFFRRRRSA